MPLSIQIVLALCNPVLSLRHALRLLRCALSPVSDQRCAACAHERDCSDIASDDVIKVR